MTKKKINSRAKGIRGELEACKLLSKHGFPAIRSQQHMGASDASDVLVPRLDKLLLFPEIKRVESLRMNAWMKKCDEDINTHHDGQIDRGDKLAAEKVPMIMHKRSKEPWFITMKADDFLILINKLEGVA